MRLLSLLLALCVVASVSAADSASTTTAATSIVLAAAPVDTPVSVAELRASQPQAGQRVTVRAQIGGRNPPWIPGVAMMMIADAEELNACRTATCGAPWDFCSAPVDKLVQHTGVVRWVDAAGNPQQVGFEQMSPIAPLSTVVITGVVAAVPDPQMLVIDADGLFLEDPGPFAQP